MPSGHTGDKVIIIGGGPVGHATALALARKGAKVTILEAEDRIIDSPRAAVYLPTTLKFLDELGILPDAHEVGVYNTRFQFKVRATGESYVLDTARLAEFTDYAYQLHFGQDVLAQIVQNHLLALPDTEVRFSTRLLGFTQDDDGVTLTVSTADGTEEELHCDWLIGTDGSHSTVRRTLGLEFQGHTWPDRFVATNIYCDEIADYGLEMANFCTDPDLWAVVAIVAKNNLWRVTYNEDGEIGDEEAHARVPDRLQEILPGAKYELSAAAPYRVHERAAERFRVGRVLLAGDAAHVCNPCGGMGLTGGIMDAKALGDALGAVINGEAEESLLDFYDAERRRVYWEVITPAATEYKRIIGESDPEKQRQDRERFRRAASDPDIMRQTSSALRAVEGRPMLSE